MHRLTFVVVLTFVFTTIPNISAQNHDHSHPVFAPDQMSEAFSWDGRETNLTCKTQGNSDAKINWLFEGRNGIAREVIEGPNIQRIGDTNESTLVVRPISRDMFGIYACMATNQFGLTGRHLILLSEARPPGQVKEVTVLEKTRTSVTFKIVGPEDNGGVSVDSFLVQYKWVKDSWDQALIKSWPVEQESFTVKVLKPKRTYAFRFAAQNSIGRGDWAQMKFEVMPQGGSPPGIPFILPNASPKYSDRFDLHWTIPEDNGEKIEFFQITYTAVDGSAGWTPYGTLHEEIVPFGLGLPGYLVENLTPDTFYRIQVRAHNGAGYSNPSQILTRTLPTDAEDELPPLALECIENIRSLYPKIVEARADCREQYVTYPEYKKCMKAMEDLAMSESSVVAFKDKCDSVHRDLSPQQQAEMRRLVENLLNEMELGRPMD